jgi:DNA-binding LacI/PurR family transcriptional regulator
MTDQMTNPRRRPPNMHDVARLAGVSHQTVSRVLNAAQHVSPPTRARVRDAMAQLDYRPNPQARALVTGRTGTLGIVTSDTALHGPATTLASIVDAAYAAAYRVSIVSVDAPRREGFTRALDRLRVAGVEGVLIVATRAAVPGARWDLPPDLPVVAVEDGPDGGVPFVAVDQYHGARLATEHLLSLGHSTVHHIAGPADWNEATQRVRGWQDALAAASARIPKPLRGDWSPQAGYTLSHRLLKRPGVTAVFVANDQMALGLLRCAHELGLRVPRDISVVGFDDVPEAEYFATPLTTVRQDFAELGRRGVDLLLAEIRTGVRSLDPVAIPATLVERSSTAGPRK